MKTISNKKIMILIVDDDRIIREELEKELKRNFFETLLAPDGKTAQRILAREEIDILLLDVKLPDMNGLEILKSAKKENQVCEVIVITGFGTHDIAVQALKSGAIDYIEKPFDMNDLSTALGRAQESLAKKKNLSDNKNTLLVIDDDAETAKRLQKVFESNGYNALVAFSGKEGLKIIEKKKIDVLISDINMDDMDGNEVLRRAKELYQDIEGIMITGFKDQEMAIQSLRSGAIDYITKPINIEELLFSIQKAVERIRLQRNRLYRDRETKITSKIITRMNEELEKKIDERTRELTETQTRLFQTSKLAILGEMAAGLAHEINQPLAGIMLTVENLRKLKEVGKLTDKGFQTKLDDLKNLSRRIDRTIKHMRTFARQDEVKFEEMNINEAIESVLDLLLGQQLRLHEIEVIKNLSQELPMIIGEPYQIEQVIVNLISNARDAMDKKEKQILEGRLSVSGYKKILKIITSYNMDDKTVETAFVDNGTGMPKKVVEKIFVPFITTKDVTEGCGLGMSISYGIIKNHQGTINVESKEGKGTTIKVILPVK